MNSVATIATLTLLALGSVTAAAAQDTSQTAAAPSPIPTDKASATTEASPELIAQGDKVFHGPGNCYACHGSNAQGAVGPNLTDAEWIHSKGTLDEIAAQVTKGVPKEESKSGIPMPPKGGSSISDEDVRAVAAYVYSLSHK